MPLEVETIHSISQTCHALGVSSDAGKCHRQGAEAGGCHLLRNRQIQSYTSKNNLTFMSLFWAPYYFRSLNQVSLPQPGMLILIHDSVWAYGGTKYVTKVYGYVIKLGCPAMNLWTLLSVKCGTSKEFEAQPVTQTVHSSSSVGVSDI